MWRCFSSGLLCAALVAVLVAWGQGFEHVMLPEPAAIAAGGGDEELAPPCCEGSTGQTCQVWCTPLKVEPFGSDRIAAHSSTRPEELEHLDGRGLTPEPMPPEAARA